MRSWEALEKRQCALGISNALANSYLFVGHLGVLVVAENVSESEDDGLRVGESAQRPHTNFNGAMKKWKFPNNRYERIIRQSRVYL